MASESVGDLAAPSFPTSEGNATLKELFRHHAWATCELIAFCAPLPPERLSHPLDLEPPEVQPWDFADTTGRSRWVKPE